MVRLGGCFSLGGEYTGIAIGMGNCLEEAVFIQFFYSYHLLKIKAMYGKWTLERERI
jgi:hypothetical protein